MRIPDSNPYASLEKVLLGSSGVKNSKIDGTDSSSQPDPSAQAPEGDSVQISTQGQEIAALHQQVMAA